MIKKAILTGTLAFLFSLVLLGTTHAQVVWQVGNDDGAGTAPDIGAVEFLGISISDYIADPASAVREDVIDYDLDADANPQTDPQAPGYLNDGIDNVCDFNTSRAECTDTTETLNIDFTLDCNYSTGMTLVYGRYGPVDETDDVFFDGFLEGLAGNTGGNYGLNNFILGPVSAGPHTVTLTYRPSGPNEDGHYIDFVRLDGAADSTCEIGIDVKPGSFPNCMKLDGHGVIPVAILGSDVFDVSTVDQESLLFGDDIGTLGLEGLAVRIKRNGELQCAIEDVTGDFTSTPEGEPDGYDDLVCKFLDADGVEFVTDGGSAVVTGSINGGPRTILGSDTVCQK